MKKQRLPYKNIFWFLIDGLCPQYLFLDNFLGQLLSKGTVFDNVITTGGGTHISMHSIFTSLLPSYNGATGWAKEALRDFDQKIFTVADYFQMAGYETFRYCDADGERTVPMSGFLRWESSGIPIGKILVKTDMTKTNRRNRFIEDVNICKKNKFVYHHIELLHDLNGALGSLWKHEDYEKNVMILSEEFEKIINEYIITEEDLVVISSDHGMLLDLDYIKDGIENGERHYEQSVRSFYALIGEGITPQVLSDQISALDEAPTLLSLTLGSKMKGQGVDLTDYMSGGILKERLHYREKGTFNCQMEMRNPFTSDVFYIRDGKWKYVYGIRDTRCEWLIDLSKDRDYENNLKDIYPETKKKYRELIRKTFEVEPKQYKLDYEIKKEELPKKFSVILKKGLVDDCTLNSLMDMSGPYYEILSFDEKEIGLFHNKNDWKIKVAQSEDSLPEVCKGEWIVFANQSGEWSEYFLSDLYRYILCHRTEAIKIIGKDFTAIKKSSYDSIKDAKSLFVGDEIRSRVEVEDISKKIILFGCGEIGRRALQYYGDENVFCFVDNNASLVGKQIYGKEIISAEKLQEIYPLYRIVISAKIKFALQIREQLKRYGIADFQLFEAIEKDSNYETLYALKEQISFFERTVQNAKCSVEFYLCDAFEIFQFKPFYEIFRIHGISAVFVAEKELYNTASNWFDYENAVKILSDLDIQYKEHYDPNAQIVFTTQSARILQKYTKAIKINVTYGCSFNKSVYWFSAEGMEGFDYKFVHGTFMKMKCVEKNVLQEEQIKIVGYPKHYGLIGKQLLRSKILQELKINEKKTIICYFPTWDEDSSIKMFRESMKELKKKYFIVTKPHHVTYRRKEKEDELRILCEISDIVLDGNYDIEKAAMIGDINICDAKSGAALEICFINAEAKAILLSVQENLERYFDHKLFELAYVVNRPDELEKVVHAVEEKDIFQKIRNQEMNQYFDSSLNEKELWSILKEIVDKTMVDSQ